MSVRAFGKPIDILLVSAFGKPGDIMLISAFGKLCLGQKSPFM